MSEYRLSASAQQDLYDIAAYYVNIANETIANRQIARLYYRFQLLVEYPRLGIAAGSELRRYHVPDTAFVILYYPRADYVEIARIIHGVHRVDLAVQ